MEPSQVWQIIILIILLILSGFFSMSETALMALSKIRIRHMVEDGVKGAKLVEKLTEDPNKLLGAILIGNNIFVMQMCLLYIGVQFVAKCAFVLIL